MAINKQKSSLGVKIILIILIVAFVALFIPLGLSGLFSSAKSATQTATGAAGGQSEIDAINVKYAPGVQTLQQAVASAPTSFTAWVNLGNTYLDWGGELQSKQTTPAAAAALPLFDAAKGAYAKALAIKKNDPNVQGDYAIALFYTGDTAGAIKTGEAVVKIKPDFAPVWFNLGNFYKSAGDSAKAKAAYTKYLQLQPNGQFAAAAKQNISTLK